MSYTAILAADKNIIPYRKELNAITGSVTATLLLSQIIYWHSKSGCFYKFNKPCSHPLYKAGDSWEEELSFSTGELRSAMSNLKNAGFVSSHTDNQRLTKYTLHTTELELALISVYKQQQPVVKATTSSCKINNNQLLNCDLPLLTETTTETTHKTLMSCKQDVDAVERSLVDYLNTLANRNYKPVPSNIKLLRARLAEGHTPQEIADVIARKCAEWLDDPRFSQYLRPATLFNAEKFNQYVGELGLPLPPKRTERQKPSQINDNSTGWSL